MPSVPNHRHTHHNILIPVHYLPFLPLKKCHGDVQQAYADTATGLQSDTVCGRHIFTNSSETFSSMQTAVKSPISFSSYSLPTAALTGGAFESNLQTCWQCGIPCETRRLEIIFSTINERPRSTSCCSVKKRQCFCIRFSRPSRQKVLCRSSIRASCRPPNHSPYGWMTRCRAQR